MTAAQGKRAPKGPDEDTWSDMKARGKEIAAQARDAKAYRYSVNLKASITKHLRWAVKEGMNAYEAEHGEGARPEARDLTTLLDLTAADILSLTSDDRRSNRMSDFGYAVACAMKDMFRKGWMICATDISLHGASDMHGADVRPPEKYHDNFMSYCSSKMTMESLPGIAAFILIHNGSPVRQFSRFHGYEAREDSEGRRSMIRSQIGDLSETGILALEKRGLMFRKLMTLPSGRQEFWADITPHGLDVFEWLSREATDKRVRFLKSAAGRSENLRRYDSEEDGLLMHERCLQGLQSTLQKIRNYRQKAGWVRPDPPDDDPSP